MAWLTLIFAGILEIVWASGLKFTDGFTRPIPSFITIAAMVASFWLLSLSMRSLPLGVSYAIWTGIGTVGTVLFGIFWLGEAASVAKLVFIACIIVGMIGLKVIS